jgi:glycosyltransferase involved in cell wall biosynthesis
MDDVAFSTKPDAVAFTYELELDAANPLITLADSARLHGRFRHFHKTAIALAPGISGAYNIGVKLFPAGSQTQLFEDRMAPETGLIEPASWVGVSVLIPRAVINFRESFTLTADVLKEDEFWFASRGAPELQAALTFADSLAPPHEPPAFPPTPRPVPPAIAEPANSQSATTHLVFDVSDLIQYFNNARLPTGIQRVQIEVITSLITAPPEDCTLKIACFTKQTDTWVDLSPIFFSHICHLALLSGDTTAPDWLRALEELRLTLAQARRLAFRRGAYLINLGTSWWLQNYFLHVRAAKARYGIRYVPFVHDCIPIMTPEHCVENLTRDFIAWALGAFQHADHIIVNSRATAADVKLVAARLGHAIPDTSVVTLDADYRAANARIAPDPGPALAAEIFLKHEIRPAEYVLFVATIESRKNHMLAFSAWLNLAKKHGRAVPKLVCVGNRGWLNDAIYSKLAASKILQERVVMLSGISDADLELLYRNCLFTLYPSSYEGWGLPVTESLCFGKVPVLANTSSLPEAGGDFAEYFDPGSETALLQTLERMMFDAAYRQAREQHIAETFRPRPWSAIASSIVALASAWARADQPADQGREAFAAAGLWPFAAQPGRYYGLTENQYGHIWPGMVAGEMFRQGDAWWWPEPWGAWTKARTARLAFLAPFKPKASAILYIGIRGVQGTAATAAVTLEGVGRRVVKLGPDQTQWLVFRVPREVLAALPRNAEGILFDLLFSADKFADFHEGTEGRDHRTAGIGVCGFMVCAGDDVEARMSFVESVALNDMASLFASADIDTAVA